MNFNIAQFNIFMCVYFILAPIIISYKKNYYYKSILPYFSYKIKPFTFEETSLDSNE